MDKFKTIPFALAAVWSIGASIYLLLTPMRITELVAQTAPETSKSIEQVERQVSWYQVQGIWGVVLVLAFALLYSGTWISAARGRYGILAILSVTALTLTFLAGFSIGPLYFPALVGVVAGWWLMALGKIFEPEQ